MRKAFKSNFVKNVFIIAGGTAFAQLISAALTPVITRIYSPEEYGILTVYAAILSVLSILGSLKYEFAIAIADDEEKAINVLILSIIILTTFVGIISLILFFFGQSFLGMFNGGVLIEYRFLIPLGIFFAGLYNIFNQWAFRNKNFKTISKTKLSQAIAQNLIKITFGLFKLGPIGLILGSIFGQSAGITALATPLIKQYRELLKNISMKEIIWCAKRYVRYPLFSAPSQLLNIMGIQLPVLFITTLFGSEVLGFYGLANGIINMPMNLIGTSVGDVFYGEAARIGRSEPEKLKELSNKLLKKLILIGLTQFAILILFGPALFSLVFGNKWHEAGVYSRLLSVFIFARLIFAPISRVFSAFEKQKEAFFLDSMRVVLVLIVFVVSKLYFLNSYFTIGMYAISMSIVYSVTYICAQRIINNQIKFKLSKGSMPN